VGARAEDVEDGHGRRAGFEVAARGYRRRNERSLLPVSSRYGPATSPSTGRLSRRLTCQGSMKRPLARFEPGRDADRKQQTQQGAPQTRITRTG